MQPRVTVILVVQSGAEHVERTLAALRRQTRAADFIMAADIESADRSRAILAAAGLGALVSVPAHSSFGTAVAKAELIAPNQPGDEWLWLLAHDNAPAPDALEQLLAAVEISPSLAVVGPKLMRADAPDVIAGFGESVTRFGATVHLVEGELDQAQHDARADVLGVAGSGMLVRRAVWNSVGGFDPGLPSVDAGLDFSIRARLAGNRVGVVPAARISSAGGPETLGRRHTSEARRWRVRRAAQLHRRLVYAPFWAVPLHWLSFVPLAFLRSLGLLLAKRPLNVPGEFGAAFSAAFAGLSVARARRRLRSARGVGWKSIARLRLTPTQAREFRARRAEIKHDARAPALYEIARVGVVPGGALWVALAVGILGLVAFGGLIGAPAVVGGGLLPLSDTIGALWSNVGYGWRPIDGGFEGAADPFAVVLAVLGSLTFWHPSLAIVLLYLLALPIASLGAWFFAREFSTARFVPAIAALAWSLAPSFIASLNTGHLGSAIAHLLLPWLAWAALRGVRSWASAAAASLLFAAVSASAPILLPALVVLWLAMMIRWARVAGRLVVVVVPTVVLFLPIALDQFARGTPLALLVDPGVPSGGATGSALQLATGSATDGWNGWQGVLDRLGGADAAAAAPWIAAVLIAPVVVLAMLSLFTRDLRRAVPALLIALIGFVVAVAGTRLELSVAADATIAIWPGSGLSLMVLGLLGGAAVSLERIGRAVPVSATLLAAASALAALPLIASSVLAVSLPTSSTSSASAASPGSLIVAPGSGRILPAFVVAESTARPSLGTLVIDAIGDGAVSARVQRGAGETLDQQSTLAATAAGSTATEREIALLAANLISRSGLDAGDDLDELAIGFVVLSPGASDDSGARSTLVRAQEALDANELFVPVGETPNGLLWRYTQLAEGEPAMGPSNTGTPWGVSVLVSLAVVGGVALLLAIPTGRGPRVSRRQLEQDAAPAPTFDEDIDD